MAYIFYNISKYQHILTLSLKIFRICENSKKPNFGTQNGRNIVSGWILVPISILSSKRVVTFVFANLQNVRSRILIYVGGPVHLRRKTTSVIEGLKNACFNRHGIAEILLSDQENTVGDQMIREMCRRFGMQKIQ